MHLRATRVVYEVLYVLLCAVLKESVGIGFCEKTSLNYVRFSFESKTDAKKAEKFCKNSIIQKKLDN